MVNRILVAIGDKDHATDTVKLAGSMAHEYGAEVFVMHVWEWAFPKNPGGRMNREPFRMAQIRVQRHVRELRKRGIWAQGLIVSSSRGTAAKEILRVAEDQGVDLIVMGSRGQSRWSAFCRGSVAQKVIARASCPVTVAREVKHVEEPVRRGHLVAVQ